MGEPQIVCLKASSPSPASREGGERQRSAHCELGQDSVGLHLSSEQKLGIRAGLHLSLELTLTLLSDLHRHVGEGTGGAAGGGILHGSSTLPQVSWLHRGPPGLSPQAGLADLPMGGGDLRPRLVDGWGGGRKMCSVPLSPGPLSPPDPIPPQFNFIKTEHEYFY